MLLLESVAHSRELESSLKNKNLDLDLREREGGAQTLDLKGCFDFLSGQQPKGLGGGLFVVSTSKELLGRIFTRLVQWGHQTSLLELSRSQSRSQTWLVHQTSPVRRLSKLILRLWKSVQGQTSPVPTPHKSGRGF
jgi:hypothetical protein